MPLAPYGGLHIPVKPNPDLARIDWTSSLTQGLKNAYLFPGGGTKARDYVAGSNATMVLANNGDAYVDAVFADAIPAPGMYQLASTNVFSIVVGMTPIGTPNGNYSIFNSRNDTVAGGCYLRLGSDLATFELLESHLASFMTATVSAALNKLSHFGMTCDSGANYQIFEGGVIRNSVHNGASLSANTAIFGAEGNGSGWEVGNATFRYAYVWNRVITASEIQRLYVNPYEIFIPQSRRYIISAAAAPAGTSLGILWRPHLDGIGGGGYVMGNRIQ